MAAEGKYDERIFGNLESFSKIQFALLTFGPLCNATKSCSYTDADCDYLRVKDGDIPVVANFCLVFKHGISILKGIRDGKEPYMSNQEKSALQKLDGYVKEIEHHERCLRKVLMRQQCTSKYEKTEVTVAVVTHLLGILAPGDTCISDRRVKEIESCPCDCCHKPNYSCTGIGHEEVWHGDIDVVFSSPTGIPESIATVPELSSSTKSEAFYSTLSPASPMKRPRIEDEELEIYSGMKSSLGVPSTAEATDQALAQITVFSLLQKQRHPEFQCHLIPNIVISPTDFQIFMYDAVNDILLGSYPLKLFDIESDSLRVESVIILWMVLHYQMFCEGIKVDRLTDDFQNIDIQSGFRKIAQAKWDVYSKLLKENVEYFTARKRKPLLTYENYWFAKELAYNYN